MRSDSTRTKHRAVRHRADGDVSEVTIAGHLQVVLTGLHWRRKG